MSKLEISETASKTLQKVDTWHFLSLPYAQSMVPAPRKKLYDLRQFIFNTTMMSVTSAVQWFDYSFCDFFFFFYSRNCC